MAKTNQELDLSEDIEDIDADEDSDDIDVEDIDDEDVDTSDSDDDDIDDEDVEEEVVESKPTKEEKKKDKKDKDEKKKNEKKKNASDEKSDNEMSIADIKAQNVFGDLQILKRKGKFIEGKKGIEMRKAFMKDELVSVLIPVDPLNPKLRIHEFQMSSLYFIIPLGKPAKVPKTVADFIDQTIFATQPIHEMLIGSFN